MLRAAGLNLSVLPAAIDEEAIRAALSAGGAAPRDIADALAGQKARRVSARSRGALVLGADQIAECGGRCLSKPRDPAEAAEQLRFLSGRTHRLFSAAVVFDAGMPVWRHVGMARLTMHSLGESFLRDYVARNWEEIRHTVGAYRIEGEGVRLFGRIEGDPFTIIGLPLIELLTWLRARGDIAA